MFRYALTRQPAPDFVQGITTSQLGAPDYTRMLAQHGAYENALRSLGLEIIHLEVLEGYPDAYFVEDTAIVLPELAVITRPGALARQGEQTSIAQALAPYRTLAAIQLPGTLEGGDVFLAEKHLFIGLSERTNQSGAQQLAKLAAPHGYQATFVPVGAGLHLKSSANPLSADTLLVTQEFAGREEFASFKKIILHPEEEYAANTLWVNDHLLMPAGFPRTREQLEKLGVPVIELDVSEAQKMDGGLTCMSLRF